MKSIEEKRLERAEKRKERAANANPDSLISKVEDEKEKRKNLRQFLSSMTNHLSVPEDVPEVAVEAIQEQHPDTLLYEEMAQFQKIIRLIFLVENNKITHEEFYNASYMLVEKYKDREKNKFTRI